MWLYFYMEKFFRGGRIPLIHQIYRHPVYNVVGFVHLSAGLYKIRSLESGIRATCVCRLIAFMRTWEETELGTKSRIR